MEREPNPQETQIVRTCEACGRRFGVLNPKIRRCLRCRRIDILWERGLGPPPVPAPIEESWLERHEVAVFWIGVVLGLVLVGAAAALATASKEPESAGPWRLEGVPNPFGED